MTALLLTARSPAESSRGNCLAAMWKSKSEGESELTAPPLLRQNPNDHLDPASVMRVSRPLRRLVQTAAALLVSIRPAIADPPPQVPCDDGQALPKFADLRARPNFIVWSDRGLRRSVRSPDGRLRTIAVTHQHLLLLALLLASPILARAEDIAPPPVPRFEPAPCPKLSGGRRAGQSELRLPRRTGKSEPAEWPHHSAHGREIPRPLSGETT